MAGEPYYGFKSDIWSLGIILYALICGKLPFKGKSLSLLRDAIVRGTFDYPKYVQAKATTEFKDLMSKLLMTDPTKRITIP